MDAGLAIFFLLVVAYALFASPINRWLITMPIFFVAAGILLGDVTPQLSTTVPGVESLTEVTLALLLFADASTLRFREVTEDHTLTYRLLLFGLLFSIAIGGVMAFAFFPEEGIWFALLLASILTPTDAALGLPIFNNPKLPVRIRRTLNVESGLNDGIITPFVTLFLALALVRGNEPIEPFLLPALAEITIALIVATVVGVAGGRLFSLAAERKWSSLATLQMGGMALALAAYTGSVSLGGNGFIAAFVAGLLFAWMARGHAHELVEFTETSGTMLSLFVWTMFGASVMAPLLQQFDWRAFVFAILALTLMRMSAVAMAMWGAGLRRDTIAMMGWFGPRGLASVVFTLIALESFHEAGRSPNTLIAAAGWTILLSIFLHGLSAQPLANWYARRLENAAADIPELADAPDVMIRRPHLAGGETRPSTTTAP